MSPPLGRLQRLLLAALKRHGRESSLQSLAELAAGLITTLDSRSPCGRVPTRAMYSATARAVAGLRRRGLVHTQVVGTARGRMEWPASGKSVWRFRNPSTRLIVSLAVDTLAVDS